MKRLSEGATAVTAVFLLMTTAIAFFFSVNKHLDKNKHRQALEEKDEKYRQLLKESQDELRKKEQEHQDEKGISPTNTPNPSSYPQPYYDPFIYESR